MRRVHHVVFMLTLFLALPCFAQEANTGHMTGRLLTKEGGQPLAGGMAFFFKDTEGPPPLPELYWRVPDEIAPIDGEGKFLAELVEGTYYIGAIKRASAVGFGPPLEGDQFFVSQDSKGLPQAYTVKKGQKTDIGVKAGAVPYKKGVPKGGVTAIAGAITTGDGKPVVGALVFAYVRPDMLGRPLFVSERTGKDGRYLLRVLEGTNYYLRVRDTYGGGPLRDGGVMGVYGGEMPLPITVKKGETTGGINVTITPFPGRGPDSDGQGGTPVPEQLKGKKQGTD